ncbi:MAG: formyltransferase family protein, partial [Ignavibacteriaceae bacterium]
MKEYDNTNSEKLNIIVLTQEEHFFIPRNIFKASKVANVKCVVNNITKSSLTNKRSDFLKWFGIAQFAKMGILVVIKKIMSLIDRLANYKTFKGENSIKDMAGYLGVDYKEISDVNSDEFADYVKKNNIDLIVSYSAPQIVREKVLSIPKYGIINVHGSLLPEYRGALPSFWYLYKNEKFG